MQRASRRTVVRTAAWTAPAVAVAVAAPAAAATSSGTLDVNLGQTFVQVAARSAVRLWNFSVTPRGRGVLPGELTMTVTFAPTPPSTEASLYRPYEEVANQWLFPPFGTFEAGATQGVCTFLGSLAPDQPSLIVRPTHTLVNTGVGTVRQPGAFVLALRAPGFAPTTLTLPIPVPQLEIVLGATHVEISETTGRARLVFQGLTIKLLPLVGVRAGGLELSVSFRPDTPGSGTGLDAIDRASGDWAYTRTATDVDRLAFVYGRDLVDPANPPVSMPDGAFVETHLPVSEQPGTFVLTATVTGYSSATADVAG